MRHLTNLVLFSMLFLSLVQAVITVGTGCPLDFSNLNFTEAISTCSEREIGKCCRYVNALVGISIARYANATGQLGVSSTSSKVCIGSISDIFQSNGLSSNATAFCGMGTKVPVNFHCKGRKTIQEMEQTSKFKEVSLSCMNPILSLGTCRKCLNASLVFLHHLLGAEDNMTLSTCRDATFVAIASHGDSKFAVDLASCFFGLQGLGGPPVLTRKAKPFFEVPSPSASPTPKYPSTSAQSNISIVKRASSSHNWTLIASVGIGVTVVTISMFILLVLLIYRKRKELKKCEESDLSHWNRTLIPSSCRQFRKWKRGESTGFQRFSYKEIRIATNDFSTIIGRGGFGSVYKGRFKDGFVAAVKHVTSVSGRGKNELCKEMELLGRLHHRHLVTLRGFCAEQHERFLMYEYMENGSLKEHLHASTKTRLTWRTRIQIAVDVASALEYLHFYCDPPLCHRDIKSSNILLDENFVAKVADFGLAHAAPSGSNNFEPINTDVRGTPGYMDPEYVITQELTEKSDIYSYGVLLLELITARRAVHENKNLVEWAETYITTCSRLPEIVDPGLADNYDFEELQTLVSIVRMCTHREGKSRPSIKQVLRILYDKVDTASRNLRMPTQNEYPDNNISITMMNEGKIQRVRSANGINLSGDLRCLQSSPSTSRSYCSRSFLLESGSPQSPVSAPGST